MGWGQELHGPGLRKAPLPKKSTTSRGFFPGSSEAPAKKAKTRRLPRLRRIPSTLPYPKIDPRKNPYQTSKEEKIVGLGGAYAARAKLAKAAAIAKELGSRSVRSIPKGGVVGLAALAAAAAWTMTRAVINRQASTKQELQENAYELSQAYRRMRLRLAEEQRRPLTPAQQRAAAAVFQRELLKLGLSSHALEKLKSSWFK
jgi:hypothetical protein